MDTEALGTFVRKANFVAMEAAIVALHAASIAQINKQVAEGALFRVGVDDAPESFETFRARYADESK
jgi:hypothetical protein